MKQIIIFLKHISLISILLMVSCSDDDTKELTEFSDVLFVNSKNALLSETLGAEVGEAITFLDLSQGALTHKWVIQEGAVFLRQYEEKDTLNLKPFIINNQDKVTSNVKARVLFQKAGKYKVRLENTFKEEVTFNTGSINFEINETVINSTKNDDGTWSFVHEYDVEIFNPVKASFKVSKNGVDILTVTSNQNPQISQQANWPTIEVESGDALVFTDLTSIGSANARDWFLTNIDKPRDEGPDVITNAQNEEERSVNYFALGEFTAGEFRAKRNNGINSGNDTKLIPLIIKVIPSSAPFIPLGTGVVVDQTTLQLKTTASIDKIASSFDSFDVSVTNSNQPSFNTQIPVTGVSVSPEDPTALILELAERTFDDDIISISYTSNNNIISQDDRKLESFSDVKVLRTGTVNNVLNEEHYGFESAEAAWFIQHKNNVFIGPERSFNGSLSIKFDTDGTSLIRASAGGANNIPSNEAKINLDAGTYDMSFYVYIESGAPSIVQAIISSPFKATLFDLKGLPTAEWTKVTQRVVLKATSESRFQLQVPAGSGGAGVFFVDDIAIELIDNRPI